MKNTYLEALEACKTLGRAGADILMVKLYGEDDTFSPELFKAIRVVSNMTFEQFQFVLACKEKKITPKCEFILSDGKTYFVLPGKEDVVDAEFTSFGKIYPTANYKFGMRNTCCDGIADLLNKEIKKIKDKAAEEIKAKHKAEDDAARARYAAEWGF